MRITEYVNEAKRTCVVVISETENDFRRRVDKLMRARFGAHFYFRGTESYINGPIRGKAICSPEDTFDATTGLAIARARALNKYNEKYNAEVERITDVLDKMMDAIQDFERDEWHDEEEFYPENA